MQKDKELTEDDLHRLEQVVQDNTNNFISQIDKILEKKEKDLTNI